jgi:hypothetical protein
VNSQPFVIPMLYARSGHTLYLHGSAASRTLQALETASQHALRSPWLTVWCSRALLSTTRSITARW